MKLLFLVTVWLGLLILRRPDQVLHPYVWDEDGTWNIPGYLKWGVWSIFQPVQGYLIIPTKLITYVSLRLSGMYYPEISTALTIIVTIFCIAAIAFSPTLLRNRSLCSMAVLVIPHGAEAYTIPLYIFWFTTLPALLALLWKPNAVRGAQYTWRLFFIVIGGLSSPLIIALTPLFFLRSALRKEGKEYVAAALALSLSLVQLFVILKTDHVRAATGLTSDNVPLLFKKFFGFYFFYPIRSFGDITLPSGVILLIIGYYVIRESRQNKLRCILLLGAYCVSIATILARIDVRILDPFLAGPRYFFYPYIILSWILLTLIGEQWNKRVVLVLILALPLLNSAHQFIRRNQVFDWRRQLANCLNADGVYQLPIHFDGNIEHAWSLEISSQDCARIIDHSFFDRRSWTPLRRG
ncbi:MAG TPA: hypothetical protein VNN62_23625 [Methylomirabilota bacterium]|nr:hypothetical protein [Methylomirabilota bacterium]